MMADDRGSVLDAALMPAGFKRKGNGYFRRTSTGANQWIGFRRSRRGDKSAAIHFAADSKAEGDGSFESLSPVAPFKNTFWWPEVLSASEALLLRQQIENVALVYLDTFLSGYDPLESAEHLHSILAALSHGTEPFERKNGTYFRRRGQVIDLVDAELLGQNRFAFVHVAVWHKKLKKGFDFSLPPEERVPTGVTRVASSTVGPDSIDNVPCSSLYYLGPRRENTLAPESSMVEVILAHLSSVQDERDVLNQIRSEFRYMFPA